MLAKAAFNAILKTLEEPPPHVKFIFATHRDSESSGGRSLSRCQRSDLRRIARRTCRPSRHPGREREYRDRTGALEPDRAGRRRLGACDGLSLLDQAIAHAGADNADGPITAQAMRAMLGLADRGRVLDLFESLMGGALPGALEELTALYNAGVDPLAVTQ